jgi:hypothetical protein
VGLDGPPIFSPNIWFNHVKYPKKNIPLLYGPLISARNRIVNTRIQVRWFIIVDQINLKLIEKN